jgi:hypothetical protein
MNVASVNILLQYANQDNAKKDKDQTNLPLGRDEENS